MTQDYVRIEGWVSYSGLVLDYRAMGLKVAKLGRIKELNAPRFAYNLVYLDGGDPRLIGCFF